MTSPAETSCVDLQEISGSRSTTSSSSTSRASRSSSTPWAGSTINVKLSGFGTKLPIGGHSDGNGGVIGETGYFSPGRQHLSGNLALWYARTRAADSDTFRQARQRCVVQAVVKQVEPRADGREVPRDRPHRARQHLHRHPGAEPPAFVDLVERVQKAKINSVTLTLEATASKPWDPDYAKVRSPRQEGDRRAEAGEDTDADVHDAPFTGVTGTATPAAAHPRDAEPDDDAVRPVLRDSRRARSRPGPHRRPPGPTAGEDHPRRGIARWRPA